MIGFCQSMKYSAPSGPILMSDGRKLGSVEVTIGSSFKGTKLEPILSSSDPNFRPSDLKVAPDGSIYFLDWQNPIIGHLQHAIRDPSRDHTHGRIYRITHEGLPLVKPKQIDSEPIEKLLDLLKEPEAFVRSRAKIELGGRDSAVVTAAVRKWTDALDKKDDRYEHNTLEALWVHQYHNVVTWTCCTGCWPRRSSAPGPRPRASCATGATACRRRLRS